MWCVRTSETGVSVSGVVVPGGVILGTGDRMGRAGPLRAGSAGVRVCPRGWWVLHTRAHRVLVGTAESCGTALSVTVMALLPCAQTPSLHMGTRPPHTTLTRKARHSNKNQPRPHEGPGLPCATPTTTTPEARTHHAPHRDRSSSGSRSVQFSPTNPTSKHARQAQGPKPHAPPREPSTNSRPAEARPISTRNSTDLGTGYDRSRREFRPISWRNRTDLGEGVVRG